MDCDSASETFGRIENVSSKRVAHYSVVLKVRQQHLNVRALETLT